MSRELALYLRWLEDAGVRFSVADDLAREPDHDGPRVEGDEPFRAIEFPGLPPFVEHRAPAEGIAADHATFSLARTLLLGRRIPQACRFWDVGCGTGVLAAAAGLAGARVVVASDVDERAIELAKRTTSEAGVAAQYLSGSLLEPFPADAKAEIVVANLPHKPVPPGDELDRGQRGGEDGSGVHAAFARQAADRFERGTRLYFFAHSLAHPRLQLAYHENFDLTLLSWKRRYLQPGEYGALGDHFRARAGHGDSFLGHEGDRSFMVAGIWEAVRR